ncbi:hypothetical protein C2S52_012549 [Perilla frutescens var. hirtella]|nr:hypothetical protein C2S52_012549 [Perilla frutescens var. hirtella]
MVWSKIDEAVFVSFLRLRVGYVDLSHTICTAEMLRLLAKMMSKARDRQFSTIDLVMKLKELKEIFDHFENFKRLHGINYADESNIVMATDVYFSQFNDSNNECSMHKEFRLNGMDEFRAIREIDLVGGIVALDFEALAKRVDC